MLQTLPTSGPVRAVFGAKDYFAPGIKFEPRKVPTLDLLGRICNRNMSSIKIPRKLLKTNARYSGGLRVKSRALTKSPNFHTGS